MFHRYDGHAKIQAFFTFALCQQENRGILVQDHMSMFECHLQGVPLHMSYTCLAEFVLHIKLQRNVFILLDAVSL